MALRSKTRYVDLSIEKGNFVSNFFSKSKEKSEFNQPDLEILRHILTKEKAKILHVLKHEKPTSIYNLSKMLDREFKSVWQDLKLLERFGFIEFHKSKKGKRVSLIPVLLVDKMEIVINL